MKLVIKTGLIPIEQEWPIQHIQDFIWTYKRLKKSSDPVKFGKFLKSLKYKPEPGGNLENDLVFLYGYAERLISDFHTFSNRLEITLKDIPKPEPQKKPTDEPYVMVQTGYKGHPDYYGIKFFIPLSFIQDWGLEGMTEAGISMNGDELTLTKYAPGVLVLRAKKLKSGYTFQTARAKYILENRGNNPFAQVKSKDWEYYRGEITIEGDGDFTKYKISMGKKFDPKGKEKK